MNYLIEKQREEASRSAAKDPTDFFCESIAEKIKRFTPYYRNIAESRIFSARTGIRTAFTNAGSATRTFQTAVS